jgi:hypothetical protein
VLRRELVYAAAVGILAAVLAWLRLDGRTRGVVWAEDGWFLQNRLDGGPLVSVFRPYEGYLHVLPRTVIELAALVPLEDYAVTVTALCCLVVGAVGTLTYVCSRDVVRSRAARVVLGLVPVLVPVVSAEVLGNTANLHWFLLWLTPWVLLCRPTTRRAGWALAALLLVITLSETQSAMFLPLLLVGLRDRLRRPMVAAFLAGVATQVAVLLVEGRRTAVLDEGDPSLLDLVQGYGLHVFLQMFRPAAAGVGDVLVERGWSLVVAASVPFLLVLVALVATTRRRGDWPVTLAIGAGALVPFVAGMVLNFRSFLAFSDFGFETLAIFAPLRYAVVPAMFVLAAAVVVADRAPRVLGAPLLVGVLVVGLWHLELGSTNRSDGPGWARGVQRAEAECRRTDRETAEVRTSPETWEVVVSCADLTDE